MPWRGAGGGKQRGKKKKRNEDGGRLQFLKRWSGLASSRWLRHLIKG